MKQVDGLAQSLSDELAERPVYVLIDPYARCDPDRSQAIHTEGRSAIAQSHPRNDRQVLLVQLVVLRWHGHTIPRRRVQSLEEMLHAVIIIFQATRSIARGMGILQRMRADQAGPR